MKTVWAFVSMSCRDILIPPHLLGEDTAPKMSTIILCSTHSLVRSPFGDSPISLLVKSGPCSNSPFREVPWNVAPQSNTTRSFFLRGWYRPHDVVYTTLCHFQLPTALVVQPQQILLPEHPAEMLGVPPGMFGLVWSFSAAVVLFAVPYACCWPWSHLAHQKATWASSVHL